MRKLYLRLSLLLMMVLPMHLSWGQGVTTSAMNGTVTDKANTSLPGATVVAVHNPTNTKYVATTNSDGRFNIQNMKSGGPYTITATYVGFQELKSENVYLSLGVNKKVDFTLSESTVGLGEIEVVGRKDPVFNTNRTGAATNISQEKIEKMPVLNRSLQEFTRLTPQASGNSFGGRDGRFNNISIDGAVNNDVFGLSASGTPGGQTNTQPISLDAIEELQVNIAPYDVRQGSFTGAGINAVTKSGTNNIKGSLYYYMRNQSLVGDKVRGFEDKISDFEQKQMGFTLGGPIVKDKVFFFLNGEHSPRTEPPLRFVPNNKAPGQPLDPNEANVKESDLIAFRDALKARYNYDAGEYRNVTLGQENDKLFGRLDFNLSTNHKLTLRHNYVTAFRDIQPSQSGSQGGRQNSVNSIPFSNAIYTIENKTNSTVAEMNSTFGSKFANNAIFGFTAVRDKRTTPSSPFPFIDIENGSNQTITSAGYELFSANNKLDQNILQFTDNFNIFAGQHVITLGTHNEMYSFTNGFTPRWYGYYRFARLDSFLLDRSPSRYELTFSKLPNNAVPLAEFKALQMGFYAQDEYTVNENLKVTGGIRVDIPHLFDSNAPFNPRVDSTFKLQTNSLPKTQPLWSPRVGMNWDVFGDQKTQVRGGTGIFTGRVPFVWISNQVGNNGMTTGTLRIDNNTGLRFNPNFPQVTVNSSGQVINTATGLPLPGVSSTSEIAITSQNFKFPQLFRSNLGVDQKLPGGVVMTLEGMYSKDVNTIFFKDINLQDTILTPMTGDGRLVYNSGAGRPRSVDNKFTSVYLLDNTSKGYSVNLTGQLQKTFTEGPLNGLFAMAAYNWTRARDISSAPGSTAGSSFGGNQIVGNPNAIQLATSNNQQTHRIIGALTYSKKYANHFGTSVSLFYEARSGNRFSYTYGGDLNNDAVQGNDLIYVPRNKDEIVLVTTGTSDTRTIDEIWNQLNAYIEQDAYLRTRRGQYAERNGAETPWSYQLDLSIKQDFYVEVAGKKNTLQLSFDVFNFGNMLNDEWGVIQSVQRSQLLSFRGTQDGTLTGRPTFSFPAVENNKSFRDNLGLSSRWQGQVGIRYIFN